MRQCWRRWSVHSERIELAGWGYWKLEGWRRGRVSAGKMLGAWELFRSRRVELSQTTKTQQLDTPYHPGFGIAPIYTSLSLDSAMDLDHLKVPTTVLLDHSSL